MIAERERDGRPRSPRELLEGRVSLEVVLAEREVEARQILDCEPGSIIVLGRIDPTDVPLRAGAADIGRGTVVQVGDRLGLRLDHVEPPAEFLGNLSVDSQSDERTKEKREER